MKTLIKIFYLLFIVFTIVSCEEDSYNGKAVTLNDGKTNYQINSDSLTLEISFTTLGEWEAKIEDITENTSVITPDWIEILQKSGTQEGKYTVSVHITENTANTSRKAALYIICKETVAVVFITQSGKGEVIVPSGSKPAKELRLYDLTDSQIIKFKNGIKNISAATLRTKAGYYIPIIITTDNKNRVTKVKDKFDVTTTEFIYDDDILTLNSYDGDNMITSVYGYEDGRVTKGISSTEGNNNETFLYTEDGYLSEYKTQGSYINSSATPDNKIEEEEVVVFDIIYKYSWDNGLFTSLHNYSTEKSNSIDDIYTFEYYEKESGISNICLNNIIIDGDMWSIFRLAGKSCDRLISKMVKNGEITTYEYEFDNDGAVSKVYVNSGNRKDEMIEIVY